MARKNGLYNGVLAIARSSGAILAADSATLTDANIDPTQILNCRGFDTIWVGVEIDAGSSPGMTIEPLFRDADAADDGSRWRRILAGAREGVTLTAAAAQSTGNIVPGNGQGLVELRVDGHLAVFLRISAVANPGSTTGWRILVMPGKTRSMAGMNRS